MCKSQQLFFVQSFAPSFVQKDCRITCVKSQQLFFAQKFTASFVQKDCRITCVKSQQLRLRYIFD